MNAPEPQQTPRHFSMLRSFQLADYFTLANAACGTAAILLVMGHLLDPSPWRIWAGLAFLPVALFFDIVDGTVARWRNKQSVLGRELDSLADIVSFGVAPAVVGFAVGMRGAVDGLLLMYFVSCGIARLARFNVTAEELSAGSTTGKVKYFEGTPIPTSLSIVAVLAGCQFLGLVGEALPLGVLEVGGLRWHPASVMYAISGSAMISKTLRIPKP